MFLIRVHRAAMYSLKEGNEARRKLSKLTGQLATVRRSHNKPLIRDLEQQIATQRHIIANSSLT